MKENFVLVVKYVAREDKIDLVKTELQKAMALIRQEKGCIQFELLEGIENPAAFTIYEDWETRALWQAHLKSEHMKVLNAALDNSLADFSVDQLSFVD